MIKLYHGSTVPVGQPLVSLGRTDLDFSPRFYLTRLQEQAEKWADRVCILKDSDTPWLNIYELDIERALADGYRHLCFEAYDRSWLDFITASRRGQKPWAEYDLIEGGVADDRVFRAIENYVNGMAGVEETLGQLAYYKPNHQICLLSQELADRHLKYISSESLNRKGGKL